VPSRFLRTQLREAPMAGVDSPERLAATAGSGAFLT
jgi:hypothetical protein